MAVLHNLPPACSAETMEAMCTRCSTFFSKLAALRKRPHSFVEKLSVPLLGTHDSILEAHAPFSKEFNKAAHPVNVERDTFRSTFKCFRITPAAGNTQPAASCPLRNDYLTV